MFPKHCMFVILVIVGTSHCRVVEDFELQKEPIVFDFSNISYPGVIDLTKLIHQSCLKDLSTDAEEYQTFKDARDELFDCLDDVFNKTRLLISRYFDAEEYCPRYKNSAKCWEVFNEEMSRCMPSKDLHVEFDLLNNIQSSEIDGTCVKDGDQYMVTQYHTTGGPMCMTEKEQQLLECCMEVDKDNVPLEKLCDKVSSIQQCIVRVMKTCKTNAAANYFESLYNVLEEEMPCKMDTGKGAVINSYNARTKLYMISAQIIG